QILPCLRGYDQLPNGLKFGENEEGFKYRGASAAESASIQAIDAFLNVKFNAAQKGFIHHIRDFMPSGHRRFIEYIEVCFLLSYFLYLKYSQLCLNLVSI
ncbi:hypothetical protein PENTCL1PPCAC_28203, partial [Pristionchus entomophagus]